MGFLDKDISQLSLSELQRLIRQEVSSQLPPIPAGVAALDDAALPVTVAQIGTQGQIPTFHAPGSNFVFTDPGAISDGIAPTSSPSLAAAGAVQPGIGLLIARWTATTNADPVGYDVHISASTGFTPSAATLVGTTVATSFTIRNLADGVSPLVYNTTYYVKLVAFDNDGAAAAGTQGSGIISADLGTITAGTLIGTTVETAASGARVVQNASGLTVYDGTATDYGAGAGIVALLPIAGNVFLYGKVYASSGILIDQGSGTINKIRWMSGATEVCTLAANNGAFTLSAALAGHDGTVNLTATGAQGQAQFQLTAYDALAHAAAASAAIELIDEGSNVWMLPVANTAAMYGFLPFPGARHASDQVGYPAAKSPYSFVAEMTEVTASSTTLGPLIVSLGGTAAAISSVAGGAGHPGVAEIETGSTSTGTAHIHEATGAHAFADGHMHVGGIVRVPVLSLLAQRFAVALGFTTTAAVVSGPPANSCYIRYVDNVNSGKWQGVFTKGGVTTTVDLTVTVTAGNWYKLEVEVSADGNTARFWVNDGSPISLVNNQAATGNIAAGAAIEKTLGGTTRTFDVDAIWAMCNLSQRWT